MKKNLFLIITGIVLVGTVCIWLLAKNKPAEQMLVARLNEAVSHYTDMNIKDDDDSPIVISSKDDVENIINADFISKENVICRLFLYEDGGKYFIEQTDNGVYTISKEDYDLIDKYIPYINYEP